MAWRGPEFVSSYQMLLGAQWSFFAEALFGLKGSWGRLFAHARALIELFINRYRCVIAWLDLPETHGLWQAVWTWRHRMAVVVVWDMILAAFTAMADAGGVIDLLFRSTPRSLARIGSSG
ncbi:transposase [Georgenia sp. Z1344]|uniref:transposase n=1 Tax=Georgenia sp. Z1344 TaxID=3416706 RepID=UPI003CE8BB4C